MEENNTVEVETNTEKQNHICFKNHCWKMCLAMVIAAFLGGFLAVYFVADQIMEKSLRRHYMMMPPRFEKHMFDNMDREFKKDMEDFGKILETPIKMPEFKHGDFNMNPFLMPEGVKIKSEFEDGYFTVTVSLKPFQGDENKINYNVTGRKLTVFGESEVKDGKTEQTVAFSHDFILPKGADTMHISKYKDGKKLVISVPVRD